MGSIRVCFVFFLIIFHNGFALHYKYDPRWKWKENQFVHLNEEYRHQTDDTDSTSETTTIPTSTYPPVVQGTSEGNDEDLLDLMVRIAETPSEWERIHQVLNQLGKSKLKSNSSHDLKKLSEKVLPKLSTTQKPSTSTRKPTPEYKLELQTKEKSTSFDAPRNKLTSKDEPNDLLKITDPKPAWPDIFKNEYEKLFWNAENVYDEEMSDEDDEDEENYFSQYQWDEEDKSVNNNQNNVNSFNRIPPPASKVASKADVNSKGPRNTNSKLSSVNSTVHNDFNSVNKGVHNEKYDFVHFLNSLTTTMNPVVVNTSRDNSSARGDNWPNFSYHRVTVNPDREKFKNVSKAFIVVSEISPKTNATIRQAHVDNTGVHGDRAEGDVTQLKVDPTEAVSLKKKSPDGKNSKAKVFRHHWRDKQKSHTKRRHHRTHRPAMPRPEY